MQNKYKISCRTQPLLETNGVSRVITTLSQCSNVLRRVVCVMWVSGQDNYCSLHWRFSRNLFEHNQFWHDWWMLRRFIMTMFWVYELQNKLDIEGDYEGWWGVLCWTGTERGWFTKAALLTLTAPPSWWSVLTCPGVTPYIVTHNPGQSQSHENTNKYPFSWKPTSRIKPPPINKMWKSHKIHITKTTTFISGY